ncbi:hypothetical protein [Blastococcus aurantiacus]|uniref:hypothetical protein n=1 Tax=Blastococcus aurantiacus TaxID=1550231 RepID=UPI000B821BA4|nr:hypothetical protein [Blastococcus aurantiacus]
MASLGALVAGALVACQAESGAEESASSSRSLEDFAQLFETISTDYNPMPSPQALAEYSQLVVTGRITGVIPGRDVGGLRTVTFVVRVDDEVTEAAKPAVVHVEMDIPFNLPANEVARHVPRDMQVAYFLVEAPTADEIPIVDERAGRPPGMPLYIPVSPQGFWIGEPGRVLQPLEHGQAFPDSDIQDVLPPSKRFPLEKVSPGDGGTTD